MAHARKVWVVDDDRSIRWVLEKALGKADFAVSCFEDAASVLRALVQDAPEVIVSDIRMPGMDGFSLLEKIHQQLPDLPVIIMTAHSDLDSAVTAYDRGAFEYLPKPFDVQEAVAQVERALQSRVSNKPDRVNESAATTGIIGAAPAMQEVFRAIGRLAKSNITVLINGESGTGKELVAKALHQHSPRVEKPFIALNMAAIPKELMESELFGHEKGSFTGAQARRLGRFEQAEAGTLFLDEIGDMPAEAQTRLLRVLADSEYYRVGGTTAIKADVRIIAATHQDLEKLVQQGRFREDLFHRLNVIRIHIPALRERREDIGLLMEFFLQQAATELRAEKKILHSDALQALEGFSWPGNVRQLENITRWLTVMASGQEIHAADLPPEVLQSGDAILADTTGNWQADLKRYARARLQAGANDLLSEITPDFEVVMMEVALEYTGGRKQDAAKLLGWGRNTLTRKLKEHADLLTN